MEFRNPIHKYRNTNGFMFKNQSVIKKSEIDLIK